MTSRKTSDTCCSKNQNIDREISDLLIAISVNARRLACKVSKLSESEKSHKGGNQYVPD